jgi:hypothetical protein
VVVVRIEMLELMLFNMRDIVLVSLVLRVLFRSTVQAKHQVTPLLPRKHRSRQNVSTIRRL